VATVRPEGAVTGGTYTLLIELEAAATITFGAQGDHDLDAGWYAYVGSALGSGGFGRIERHRELARGDRDVRHWHIDYLLGHAHTTLDGVVRSTGHDIECAVATAIDATPVGTLGASDCDCPTHLFYRADRESLRGAVEAAHQRARSV
jgi:endonuclease-3